MIKDKRIKQGILSIEQEVFPLKSKQELDNEHREKKTLRSLSGFDKNEYKADSIEQQFHLLRKLQPRLSRIIRESIKHPASFQHIQSTYQRKANALIVTVTFRARDRNGHQKVQKQSLKVSLNGEQVELL